MKQLLTVMLILCLFSCQKLANIDNPSNTSNPPNLDQEELRDQAIIASTLSKDFFSNLLRQGLSHPEIFGLQSSEQAETRTDCPEVHVSGSTFPITLTLDFGNAPGCTPPLFSLPKVGQITSTFARKLFTTGTGNDFTITLSEDYQEEGFFIKSESGNEVVFKFKYIPAETAYKITFDEDIIMESVTTGKTIRCAARPALSIPFATIGLIQDSGPIEDDPSNPHSYIDNIFFLKVLDSHITFNNVSNYCLDITSQTGNGLEFQPFVCHCITKGVLRINENSDCSTSNSNANADIIYDFGNGDCDNEVEVTKDGETTTHTFGSCS